MTVIDLPNSVITHALYCPLVWLRIRSSLSLPGSAGAPSVRRMRTARGQSCRSVCILTALPAPWPARP
eukprot:250063-Pyramimonas_sp.AAC.1